MISFKQFITENSDTETQLKKLGLRRGGAGYKIGKVIGGEIYVHKQYEYQFPQDLLNKAKSFLPEDFHYNIVKYNPKTEVFSFIISNDFDEKDEPSVHGGITIKPDGTAKPFKDAGWIYHYKWQWVADDYKGFNVEKSKERSVKWNKAIEGSDVSKSKIGQRKYWDDNVEHLVKESINNCSNFRKDTEECKLTGKPCNYTDEQEDCKYYE